MSSLFADHPGFEPGTFELTARCSAVELMVIGKPSTDFPQVWTLVPEVPTRRAFTCKSSQAFALQVGFVDSAVKSLMEESVPRTGRPLFASFVYKRGLRGIAPLTTIRKPSNYYIHNGQVAQSYRAYRCWSPTLRVSRRVA